MAVTIDQMNRCVEIVPAPQRIISLVPSQTELLHYWGLGDRVVGITKFCVRPELWYRNKQRVGGTKMVDFDSIEKLKPDLIIGNKEENTQTEIETLARNYPVWMSDMYNLSDVWQMMMSLGTILDVESKAARLVSQLKKDFKSLRDACQDTKRLRVAYFIWRKPWMIAASNTFIHHML